MANEPKQQPKCVWRNGCVNLACREAGYCLKTLSAEVSEDEQVERTLARLRLHGLDHRAADLLESQARQIATLTAEIERSNKYWTGIAEEWARKCADLTAENERWRKVFAGVDLERIAIAAARDRAVEALKLISEYSATSNMDLRSLVRYKDGMIQIAVNALAGQS